MKTIGNKITEIRKQKGLTQEEVSELAGINLRTLQRIEKGETEPRGNSLQGICAALGVPVENILDYGKIEDKSYLVYMHLSVLAGVVIPFGNIILPLIFWLNKRDRITLVLQQGANILNFQILWTILTNAFFMGYVILKIVKGFDNFLWFVYVAIALYIFNFIYPIVIAVLIGKGRIRRYYPEIIRLVR